MFPNFKSLRDKRNKLCQLQLQIDRDQELEHIKNEAYAVTDWASDQAKLLSMNQIPSSVNASTQTNNNSILGNMNSLNQSGSTQTDSNMQSATTQTDSNMQSATTQTDVLQDESGDVKMPATNPIIKPEPGISMDQAAAKDEIEYIYSRLPQLVGKKISPLKSNGLPDNDVYIGTKGKIYYRRTNRLSRKNDYAFDFAQTLNYLQNSQDLVSVKEEPSDELDFEKDKSTHAPDGAIEAEAKYRLKQILNTNDLSRFKVIPIGKDKHPKNNKYWQYPNYHIDKHLNIISDTYGKKNENSITSKISWAHTLSNFLHMLDENNVEYKQADHFTSVKNRWDSPLALSDLSASVDDSNNKASQYNLKDTLIRLCNDNDWLVDYKIHPVALFKQTGKAYKESSYVLGEYATIQKINNKGKPVSVDAKTLKSLDKQTDWAATMKKIWDAYHNDEFGKNELYMVTPKPRRSDSLADSVSGMDLSGMGLRIHGRRGILNNERYKLSGELLLGNKNSKIRKELELLNQYERK